MSSNDEDKTAPAGGSTARSKTRRPAATIDLKAEEVAAETDKDEAADASGKTAAPDEKTGGKPTSTPSAGKKSAPPPQRTKPSDVRAFVTHLAAGLVGGLVGVIGAGIGLGQFSVPGMTGPESATGKMAQVEERLDELVSKVQQQSDALAGAAPGEKLEALDNRLAAVESKPAPAPAAVPEKLDERLAGLENTLKALQTAGGEAGASGVEQAAALVGRIGRVEKALEDRTAALAKDIADAKSALADAASRASSGPDAAALDAVSARLSDMEKKLAGLAAQPVPSPTQGDGATAAAALAFESLRRAAAGSEPFKAQLDALAAVAGDNDGIQALAVPASRGVPARRALLIALPASLAAARAAGTRDGDETFLGRLASNAQSVIRIRRVGPAQGDDADAVLSRMEAHGKSGDLDAAAGEAGQLDGAAATAMAPWLEKARARIALDKALDAFEAGLLARLTGAAPDKG